MRTDIITTYYFSVKGRSDDQRCLGSSICSGIFRPPTSRRRVLELARLSTTSLHEPWRAPATVLASVGVRLGVPARDAFVEHAAAQQPALVALAACRGRSA
jgi:hypothetical protein